MYKQLIWFKSLTSRDVVLLSLVFLSFLIHLVCINYNRPYYIHPDENYIYEDPLKVLLSYSHGRFSTEWKGTSTVVMLKSRFGQ